MGAFTVWPASWNSKSQLAGIIIEFQPAENAPIQCVAIQPLKQGDQSFRVGNQDSLAKLLCYLARIVWLSCPMLELQVAQRRICGNRKICVEACLGNVILKAERMLLPNDSEPAAIRVLVTDTDEASGRNLHAIMGSTQDITLAYQATGVKDTLEFVRSSHPNVVMLDLGLADRGATRIIRPVLQEYPDIGIIVLTLHDEKQCLLEYLNWGARGFILKPAVPETALSAIRDVHQGGRFVDPLLPHCLVSHYVANPAALRSHDSTRLDVLTIREKEVCRYLASGYTNAEVADVLRISKRTVETHRAAIMSKVGVKSRAQLVHFAIEHGLWPEPDANNIAGAVRLSVAPGE